MKDEPEMTADDVVAFVELLEQNGIGVVIDGGWGVDALVGEQTRVHSDLDIAVEHRDVPRIRELLEARGYRDVPRDDTRDCNFVLGDDQGRLIDFHSYTFDEHGDLVFGVPYPPDSLRGSGSIGGHPVRCITPDWMLRFHSGYTLDEGDYHDVKVLCRRFGFDLPAEYEDFARREREKVFMTGDPEGSIHNIQIRVATSTDQLLLSEMGRETFLETFGADNTPQNMAAYLAGAFSPEIQAAELADPATRFLIAEVDTQPAGYARLRFAPAPSVVVGSVPMEIVRFYARKIWIGRGVGAELMRACLNSAWEARCDVAWLDVWEYNPRAIAFYQKWGFIEVGEQAFALGSEIQRDLILARAIGLGSS